MTEFAERVAGIQKCYRRISDAFYLRNERDLEVPAIRYLEDVRVLLSAFAQASAQEVRFAPQIEGRPELIGSQFSFDPPAPGHYRILFVPIVPGSEEAPEVVEACVLCKRPILVGELCHECGEAVGGAFDGTDDDVRLGPGDRTEGI